LPPVGNDVVDLTDPENVGKSGDRRFCRRVFNEEELALIAGSARPDTVLWALWSAKEAAYKAISRGDPSVCSIPKKYPVIFETSAHQKIYTSLKGIVKTPHGGIFIRVHIKKAFLHALAAGTMDELTRIVARVEALPEHTDDLSGLAGKILLEELAGRLGCPVDQLAIHKEKERPWAPYVTRLGARLPFTISLSHDGRFAAFAIDPYQLNYCNPQSQHPIREYSGESV